jgi:hypothetical protein
VKLALNVARDHADRGEVPKPDWWVGGSTDCTYVAPPGKFLVRVSVPEGNWGARGQTISLAMIADTVGLPKSGERFKWVRAYFDAKARARAAANYPPDTGGLL